MRYFQITVCVLYRFTYQLCLCVCVCVCGCACVRVRLCMCACVYIYHHHSSLTMMSPPTIASPVMMSSAENYQPIGLLRSTSPTSITASNSGVSLSLSLCLSLFLSLFFKGEVHNILQNFMVCRVRGAESNGEGPRFVQ